MAKMNDIYCNLFEYSCSLDLIPEKINKKLIKNNAMPEIKNKELDVTFEPIALNIIEPLNECIIVITSHNKFLLLSLDNRNHLFKIIIRYFDDYNIAA